MIVLQFGTSSDEIQLNAGKKIEYKRAVSKINRSNANRQANELPFFLSRRKLLFGGMNKFTFFFWFFSYFFVFSLNKRNEKSKSIQNIRYETKTELRE